MNIETEARIQGIVGEYKRLYPFVTLKGVGDRFGVTREYVRYVFNNHGINTSVEKKYASLYEAKICKTCYRKITKKLWVNENSDFCVACLRYKQKNKNQRIRTVLYPKNCRKCKTKLVVGSRYRGFCQNCYKKTRRKEDLTK